MSWATNGAGDAGPIVECPDLASRQRFIEEHETGKISPGLGQARRIADLEDILSRSEVYFAHLLRGRDGGGKKKGKFSKSFMSCDEKICGETAIPASTFSPSI